MINHNAAEFFKRTVTGILLIFLFGGAYLHSSTLFSLLLAGVLLLVLVFEWTKLVTINNPHMMLLTLSYPLMPFIGLIWLAQHYYSTDIYLPLLPFLIAWTADTFGYFIGKLVGSHKIYPSISPGKSWEGLLGSIVGVFAINYLTLPHIKTLSSTPLATNMLMLALFSVTMTMIAFLGGFVLSYLKRKNRLKDAGNILPGHGGFLDRFDGVLFVTIALIIILFFV